MRKLKTFIDDFINCYYPDSPAVLLTGSMVDGNHSSLSDMDVIIISDKVGYHYIENYAFRGKEVQAIVIPRAKVEPVLHSDLSKNRGVYLSMIIKGKIIKDDANFLKELINKAKQLKRQHREVSSHTEVLNYRVRITDELANLEASDNEEEQLYILLELIQSMSRLKLSRQGDFQNKSSKHLARTLRSVDEPFLDELKNTVTHYFKSGDITSLIASFDRHLDPYGGRCYQYTTDLVYNQINRDELVIYCSTSPSTPFPELYRNDLAPLLKAYPHYVFRLDRDNVFDPGCYIVVRTAKEVIRKELMPALMNYYGKQINQWVEKELRFIFPHVMMPGEGIELGGTAQYQVAEKYYIALSKLVWTNGALLNKPVVYALNIFFGIGMIQGLDQKGFIRFCDQLFKRFFPRLLSAGHAYNNQQLSIADRPTNWKLASAYEHQKDQIEQVFSSLANGWDLAHLPSSKINRFIKSLEGLHQALEDVVEDPTTLSTSFYPNFIDQIFNILFIQDRYKAYVVFVAKKIVLNLQD